MTSGERDRDLDKFDKEGLLDTNREGLPGDPDRLLEGLLETYLAEPPLLMLPLRERLEVALLLRDFPLLLS